MPGGLAGGKSSQGRRLHLCGRGAPARGCRRFRRAPSRPPRASEVNREIRLIPTVEPSRVAANSVTPPAARQMGPARSQSRPGSVALAGMPLRRIASADAEREPRDRAQANHAGTGFPVESTIFPPGGPSGTRKTTKSVPEASWPVSAWICRPRGHAPCPERTFARCLAGRSPVANAPSSARRGLGWRDRQVRAAPEAAKPIPSERSSVRVSRITIRPNPSRGRAKPTAHTMTPSIGSPASLSTHSPPIEAPRGSATLAALGAVLQLDGRRTLA